MEAATEAREKHEKLIFTLSFGTRYNDPAMFHIRDTLRELLLHKGTETEFVKLVEQRNTNVIHIMNFFEEIATCQGLGLCVDTVIKGQFDAIVISAWDRLHPWIIQHRKERGHDGIWEEVERLRKLWKK